MKYEQAGAFRVALEQRLGARAKTSGQSVQRLRKIVTFDRFLARLQHVAPDRFTLKGGLALDYRLGNQARATKDIDMVRTDSEALADGDLQRAAAADLGDHFVFEVTRSSFAAGEQEAGARVGRFRIQAAVAGRVFEDVLLDLNYTGPILGDSDVLTGPDMLAFAEIQPASIPAIAITQHLAEKLHALTRTYSGGRSTSRAKDLVDVLLIVSTFAFDAGDLQQAITDIFEGRSSHKLPAELPIPSPDWRPSFAALAREVGVEEDLDHAQVAAENFFGPLIRQESVTSWDPIQSGWQA